MSNCKHVYLVHRGKLRYTICGFTSVEARDEFYARVYPVVLNSVLPTVNPNKQAIPVFDTCDEARKFFKLTPQS